MARLLAKFTFGYGIRDADPARIAAIEEALGRPLELDDVLEDADKGVARQVKKPRLWHTYEADLSRLLPALGDVQIEVRGMADVTPLVELADRIDALSARVGGVPMPAAAPDAYVNKRVHVHVPGFTLLGMTEVDWLEDSCTQVLQDRLDAGWRILAVCPQPDQRRPDYVLGRTNPEAVAS